jgi:hypothetical protein
MITKEKFDFIKKKYGHLASWAIWAEQGDTPKSNMGDLSVLDPNVDKNLLSKLNPNIVLVALNFAADIKHEPWEVFHKYRRYGTDFKTRYALRDTPLWGAYMTDVLKNYPEVNSQKVLSHIKKHPELEYQNITSFRQELEDIGSTNPRLIAFGNIVNDILKRNLPEFEIIKIPHYAHQMNKETYREQVKEILKINDF